MELQTKLPVKYGIGTEFVPRIERSFYPEKKYTPDECAYADVIYDREGIILYVLLKKNDPEYEVTIAEKIIDDFYVPLTKETTI